MTRWFVIVVAWLLWAAPAYGQPPPDPAPPPDATQTCVTSFEEAQKQRGEQRLLEAKKELIGCAQEQCPEVVRNKCVEWLREVERAIPTIVVAVKDQRGNDTTDAAIWLDGELVTLGIDGKPIAVNPGPHELRVEIKGVEPKSENIVIVQGEQFRKVEVSFAPNRPGPQTQPVMPPPQFMPPYMIPPQQRPPQVIDWDPDEKVPPGYRKEERIRRGLVIGGAVTFGVMWAGSVIAAASIGQGSNNNDGEIALYFPVVGPFISIGTLSAEGAGVATLVIDGIAQSAGAAMLLAGIFAQKTVLVRVPVVFDIGPTGARLTGTF